MMNFKNRTGKAGFTLVEFLLALGIFAIVGLAVTASLRTGVDAWRKGEETGRVTQEARRILEDLARELRSAVSLPAQTFDGGPDRLAFDALLEIQKLPSLTRLSYGRDKITGTLLRTRRGYGSGAEKARAGALSLRSPQLSFEYPYPDPEQPNATLWKRQWTSKEKLPRGVRARLTLIDRYDQPHTFLKTLWIPVGVWP